ncbi:MAG TPA: NUDIX hydrolase [Gammaproteobacteria bacterium]|nr:NUDIX hydrolase [Gammaproteobacteria bacterium]
MNYCSQCGQALVVKIPPGDHLPRHVCPHCGAIHYQNPKLVVGCVCEWHGKVLLCRRAIEPRAGFWTLPAGFMENDETVEQGAARETREEALADAEDPQPLALVNVPHVNQVHLMFRAGLRDGRFGAGAESLEAALFEEREIPWDEIAFPSVRYTLERFFEDRQHGEFGFHISTWQKPVSG